MALAAFAAAPSADRSAAAWEPQAVMAVAAAAAAPVVVVAEVLRSVSCRAGSTVTQTTNTFTLGLPGGGGSVGGATGLSANIHTL